ncbi:MAG: hypothetical protein JXB62_11635 [Pirellulales bacterium]|nr:hypothetical protein [Pirellulales bacterium]
MLKWTLFLSCLAVAVVGLGLGGCGAPADQPQDAGDAGHTHDHDGDAGHTHGDETDADHTHDHDADAGHTHGDETDADHDHDAGPADPAGQTGVDADVSDALAELSPEDLALAQKQAVCPVSGAKLGSMGKPYKVAVQGRDVLLCCQGCEAELQADADKYLAKLAP